MLFCVDLPGWADGTAGWADGTFRSCATWAIGRPLSKTSRAPHGQATQADTSSDEASERKPSSPQGQNPASRPPPNQPDSAHCAAGSVLSSQLGRDRHARVHVDDGRGTALAMQQLDVLDDGGVAEIAVPGIGLVLAVVPPDSGT